MGEFSPYSGVSFFTYFSTKVEGRPLLYTVDCDVNKKSVSGKNDVLISIRTHFS